MIDQKLPEKRPSGRGGARPNAGRKPIIIDLEEVEKLCSRGATGAELAAAFGCSLRMIELRRKRRDFAAAELRGRAKFQTLIRNHALKLVSEGNASVILQMEKRYCHTSDPVTPTPGDKGDADEKLRDSIDSLLEIAKKHEKE